MVRRLGAAGAAVAVTVFLVAGCGGSQQSRAVTAIGAGLEGPAGLQATVYARGIRQMSAFAFDAHGRLWVTRSGSTAHGRDSIYLVASPGARPVKVVSSIRGPLGLVWVGSSLYASSLDGVERFTGFAGFAGSRFAHRVLILKGPAPAENNNLVLAPNGRLVMALSASCDHCTTSPRYSAAIVSFRTDGSDLRIVASGIRAAYGLAYHSGKLYASLNQRDDLGTKTPGDWIAIVESGQDWGFPTCYGQAAPPARTFPRRSGSSTRTPPQAASRSRTGTS